MKCVFNFHYKNINKNFLTFLLSSMYRVIQKSERTLKMINSKTNKDKKMRFAPNGWKKNRVLYGNKK